MRRSLFIALALSVLAGFTQFALLCAVAQSPPPAPGAGHGFLIDKHAKAGVTCAQCHTQSIATPPAMPTCLGCHGGSYTAVAAKTDTAMPNPHASHVGEVPCGQCHHVHKASETMCNQCHVFDMTTP